VFGRPGYGRASLGGGALGEKGGQGREKGGGRRFALK